MVSAQAPASVPVTTQSWPVSLRSVSTTFSAGPVPPACTVIVKTASSPNTIVSTTASLATPGFGQRTVIEALSSLFDASWSLLEVMLAVLAMPFAQSPWRLDIVIVIVRSPPFGMSPKSQLRVSPAATLVSAQSPASAPVIVQL